MTIFAVSLYLYFTLNETFKQLPAALLRNLKSVKRGVVKCLNDRAHRSVTQWGKKIKEKLHIAMALMSNTYPSSFLKKAKNETSCR